MRLADLDPQFLCYAPEGDKVIWHTVETIEQAQGIRFLCPKCFGENNGPVGTHGVVCWSRSRGVPDDARPGPGRWLMLGTGFHDLTLNADPPSTARSIQLNGGCGWHGYVTNGDLVL